MDLELRTLRADLLLAYCIRYCFTYCVLTVMHFLLQEISYIDAVIRTC